MTKNLLVELGLEEIPAYIVTPAMNQLRERMTTFLTDNRLAFDSMDVFSTPWTQMGISPRQQRALSVAKA